MRGNIYAQQMAAAKLKKQQAESKPAPKQAPKQNKAPLQAAE